MATDATTKINKATAEPHHCSHGKKHQQAPSFARKSRTGPQPQVDPLVNELILSVQYLALAPDGMPTRIVCHKDRLEAVWTSFMRICRHLEGSHVRVGPKPTSTRIVEFHNCPMSIDVFVRRPGTRGYRVATWTAVMTDQQESLRRLGLKEENTEKTRCGRDETFGVTMQIVPPTIEIDGSAEDE